MAKDIVLCVDDEPIVLRNLSILVATAGFRVVVAENGAAGLEAFLQLKDEVALVLADVIMPAMSGVKMTERILQIEPDARILLMSGYSDDVIETDARRRFPFIRKPFIYAVLIEKIRSIIGVSDRAASGA